MFSFFKKKDITPVEPEIFPVTTDIHSHVLPGIDDGSPDIATSILLIKGLYALGIRKMVATPHIIGDLYRNTPETINTALNILRDALSQAGIQMEISAAAEYMMDDSFIEMLSNKNDLLTVHDNMILTEQSYLSATQNLNEIAFEIITDGYKPIMAHPERYFYYHKNFDEYFHLKDMGFLFQVNLLSLIGYYGKTAKNAARFLFDNKLVDYVGTDLHHPRHLEFLSDNENIRVINKFLADKKYNELI